MIMYKIVNEVIDSLNKKQALKAIDLIYNEKGVKDMLRYFTVGSMPDKLSSDDKSEGREYMKMFRLAQK